MTVRCLSLDGRAAVSKVHPAVKLSTNYGSNKVVYNKKINAVLSVDHVRSVSRYMIHDEGT